jgi:hypothetical protein
MQREKVKVIIREISYDPGTAQGLAERTGARVAKISAMAGGLGKPGYIESIDANLRSLVAAAQGTAG